MIITKTPLRLSLLGGNTDFREYFLKYGGLVLSTTIDKYVYCIVKERFDDSLVVNYTIKENVEKVVELKHELVREALKLLGITKGIEISFMADIPAQGTGLGSSSAVTIGVLNALRTYLGENVNSRRLAEEAIKIEIDILKKPIGVQDQYIISAGGLRAIELKPGGLANSKKVVLSESVWEDFNNSLMLFYTGIARNSDDVLASIDISGNIALLDQNKILAREGVNALHKGDLKKFGQLLDTYWQLKKTLSNKISNPRIEKMYKLAKRAGAIGGKVVGAGGGGFLLLMLPVNKRAAVRQALKNYRQLPFRFSQGGSRVIFNIEK